MADGASCESPNTRRRREQLSEQPNSVDDFAVNDLLSRAMRTGAYDPPPPRAREAEDALDLRRTSPDEAGKSRAQRLKQAAAGGARYAAGAAKVGARAAVNKLPANPLRRGSGPNFIDTEAEADPDFVLMADAIPLPPSIRPPAVRTSSDGGAAGRTSGGATPRSGGSGGACSSGCGGVGGFVAGASVLPSTCGGAGSTSGGGSPLGDAARHATSPTLLSTSPDSPIPPWSAPERSALHTSTPGSSSLDEDAAAAAAAAAADLSPSAVAARTNSAGSAVGSPPPAAGSSREVEQLRSQLAALRAEMEAESANTRMYNTCIEQVINGLLLNPKMCGKFELRVSQKLEAALRKLAQVERVEYVSCKFASVVTEAPKLSLRRWEGLQESEWDVAWAPTSWRTEISIKGKWAAKMVVRIHGVRMRGTCRTSFPADMGHVLISFQEMPSVTFETDSDVSLGSVPMPFQRAVTALVREQLSKWLTKHCVAPHALKLNRNPSSSSSKTEAKVDDELKHAILAAIARNERPSSGKPTPSTPNAAATSSGGSRFGFRRKPSAPAT